MTTRLSYNWQTVIDYSSLEFNPDEPAIRPEGMYQNPVILESISILNTHFGADRRQGDVFIDTSTFICYDRSDLNVRVSPDIYIAFGVESRTIERRKLYLPWEVGKPPDFALEVGSESTARADVGRKREIYAGIGVPEYWRFDRSGGDFYGEPLAGEQLINGVYQRLPLTTEPDEVLKSYSPALDLYLCWHEGWLYFFDPSSRSYLRTLTEAEVRVRQLEEELRRRDGAC